MRETGYTDDPPTDATSVAPALLEWYDRHRRTLPWRALPGDRADPYRVWLSEIMLQQTTAAIPYYRRFVERWPRPRSGCRPAGRGAVGLGRPWLLRARPQSACLRPCRGRAAWRPLSPDEAELLALPGIGAYTAAAIAPIAFDQSASAVDGNVERVVARLFAVADPLPGAKPEIRRLAASLTPAKRPGDFTQAMMDLGASICSPRSPSCMVCPVSAHCLALARGQTATIPAKTPKKERPERRGAAFVARRSNGAVLRAAGRRKGCSAACWKFHQRRGRRNCRRVTSSTARPRSPQTGCRLPAASATPSRISIWSLRSISRRCSTHPRRRTVARGTRGRPAPRGPAEPDAQSPRPCRSRPRQDRRRLRPLF